MKKYKIAVLDDHQNVALDSADWSAIREQADIAVFQNHLADPDAVIGRLLPFDIVCVMRERTPLPRIVIERLPNLKLIASTGPVNAAIDVAAAGDHGIAVVHTGYRSDPTIEFTWALILASARNIVAESNSVRVGGWHLYGLVEHPRGSRKPGKPAINMASPLTTSVAAFPAFGSNLGRSAVLTTRKKSRRRRRGHDRQ